MGSGRLEGVAGWTPRGRRGGTGSANGPRWQGGPLFRHQIVVPRGSSVLAHVIGEDRGSSVGTKAISLAHSWVIYTSGRCRGRCHAHLHLTTVLLLREFFIWFLQKEKTRKKIEIYNRIGKGKTPSPQCRRTSTTVGTG